MAADTTLNLYTFELPENQDSHYILTSPRSLQACKQLNLRPIDLLPKSDSEMAKERPHLTPRQRILALQLLEEKRLKFLQAARKLRGSIIRMNSAIHNRGSLTLHPQCHQSALVDISETSKEEAQADRSRNDERDGSASPAAPVSAKECLEPVDETSGLNKFTKDRHNQSLHINLSSASLGQEKFETERSEKELNAWRSLNVTNEQPSSSATSSYTTHTHRPLKKTYKPKSLAIRPSSAQRRSSTGASQRSNNPYLRKGTHYNVKVQNVSPYLCSDGVAYKPRSPLRSPTLSACSLSTGTREGGPKRRKPPPPSNFHWGSAAVSKSKSTRGRGVFRAAFILRPSSANKCQTKVPNQRKGRSSSTVKYAAPTLLDLPNQSLQRTHPITDSNRKCRTARSSSDSESSTGRPPSSYISEDVLRGRPKTRRLTRLVPPRGSRGRHRRKNGGRTSAGTNNKSYGKNLSRSADVLTSLPTRDRSPSTASLPPHPPPRSPSSSSLSSLSSNSSSVSSLISHNALRKPRRSAHSHAKLSSTIHSGFSTFPSRPTSSLALPTYLNDSSGEFSHKNNSRVGRSHSAKIPRNHKSITSPRSLPLSLIRRTTSSVSLADSQILSRFLNDTNKNIQVSERDRRILELLALKHEKRFQDKVNATKQHQKWKEEREQEIKENTLKWQEWNSKVSEKRRLENEENERRMKAIEEKFHQSQENLECLLKGKEKRSQELLQSQRRSRLRQLEEKKNLERSKREVVDVALKAKEDKLEMQRQHLLKLWERQQKLVEKRKREREEINKKRLEDLSSTAQERHTARQRQVQAEGEALMEAMRRSMEKRLRRSERNLMAVQQTKEDSIKRRREDRLKKAEAVKELHNKLEMDLLRWRQHILQCQMETSRKADMRFNQNLQHRSAVVQEKLQQRQEHHKRLYEQVKERERAEENISRQVMAEKDYRSEMLAREKERKAQRAKSVAMTTAALRADLRKTYSPDTFDRKALRAEVENRMEKLSQLRRPPPYQSHIFLG